MESVGVKGEDILDRTKWKKINPKSFRRPPMIGNAREGEEKTLYVLNKRTSWTYKM